MRKFYFVLLFSAMVCSSLNAKTTNFNFDWKFNLGDNENAMLTDFDDNSWRTLDLPHDWSIESQTKIDNPAGNEGGYYATGIGWYRKVYNVSAEDTSRSHRLLFDGIYMHSKVYVNGDLAGGHGYGYSNFVVDMTPFIKQGRNVIAVRVDNSQQKNSRWYSGSGIYRDVQLMVSDKVHFLDNSTVVKSEMNGDVTVTAIVVNDDNRSRTVSASLNVNGLSSNMDVIVNPGEKKEVQLSEHISTPKLWSTETPNLYQAELKLKENDTLLDDNTVSFGFRSIEYDAENGFRLNGKSVLINGACCHHDNGIVGAASYKDAEFRKVALMKEAGFNLIRTSHNPPSANFLEACDHLGMMVIDEAFDGWRTQKNNADYHNLFDEHYKEDVQAMVRRDVNHPSIIAWSIGNEVIERKDIRVIQTASNLKNAILECDKSRPVTEALCAWDRDWEIYDPHAAVLDIAGYNYMIFKHKTDHERVPERVIWQTESYPQDAFNNWKITRDFSYVIGDMVWTGLDYLGESGIGGWRYKSWPQGESWQQLQFPWHGAYCGDVNVIGERKPVSFYRDLLWNGEITSPKSTDTAKKMHIAVYEPDGYVEPIKTSQWSTWPTWHSWDWSAWEGKNIDVVVYSRHPKVRLLINNKVVDEKVTGENEQFKAKFTLPYEKGEIKAVGLDENGNEIESVLLKSSDKPSKISLLTDKNEYVADGQGLAYIDVALTDKNGIVCSKNENELKVNIDGTASLVAFGNANLRDTGVYTDAVHQLWNGKGLIVVRAPKKSETSIVTVTGDNLKPVKLKIQWK